MRGVVVAVRVNATTAVTLRAAALGPSNATWSPGPATGPERLFSTALDRDLEEAPVARAAEARNPHSCAISRSTLPARLSAHAASPHGVDATSFGSSDQDNLLCTFKLSGVPADV